jgi:hypothetical protein
MARARFTAAGVDLPRRARWAVAILIFAGALAFAAPAGAVVVSNANAARFGVQPISAQAVSSSTNGAAASGSINGPLDSGEQGVIYHGGPVVHGLTTYALFWDPQAAFDASTENLISGYLANIADDSGSDDNVFSIAAEYGDSTGGAAQYSQTFGGAFVDSDPYPSAGNCAASTSIASTCLYDSQEVSEIESFAAAHNLPTGLSDVYIVLTPDTVVTCIDASSQCSNNSYCSFHSYASDGSSTLLYIDIPFTLLNSAATAKTCQNDGNAAVQTPNGDPGFGDVALKALSHEELETITDPLLNAWYDASDNEVADLCNGISWNPDSFLPVEGGNAAQGTLWNQTINGSHYYLQGAWSNETGGCELMSALSPTFTAPSGALSGSPLTLSAAAGTSAPIASYAWSFGDGQRASGASVTHSYTSPGQYTVTLTVTDAFGNSGSVTKQLVVAAQSGRTAASSGASKPLASTRCGAVHRGRDGRETRRCTKLTVSATHRRVCKAKSSACHAVVRTITRRERCKEVRAVGVHDWSQRCSSARVVSSRAA